MRFALTLLAYLFFTSPLLADLERCAICGSPIADRVYLLTDKVTNEKKQVCKACSLLAQTCFVCGLPLKNDFTTLPDGRLLCARDTRNAVLNDDEARHVCEETKEALDRLFSRFLTLPEKNVTTAVVDRVNLLELFKFPGNDYTC